MTCHVLRAFDIRFRLQVVHQQIAQRMRGFGRAVGIKKFVKMLLHQRL